MAGNTNTGNIDGAELFSDCLAQATLIVKQVLPSHFTNATPDAEWDVRDLTSHMMSVLEAVPAALTESAQQTDDDLLDEDILEPVTTDLSLQWQQAADRAEMLIADLDTEDTLRIMALR
ncbi:MAG: maleylpyruvate isomerase N-terminal domain-containing protein [Patescibacteria group bacterium]|nr:maleylpyruvate isomerase N-terminal domain-containing protein [Patescibacteria group bacterium]